MTEPEAGLLVRLDQAGQRLLVADPVQATDQVLVQAGAPLLPGAPDARRALAGVTADCLETPAGSELLLTRPEGGPS